MAIYAQKTPGICPPCGEPPPPTGECRYAHADSQKFWTGFSEFSPWTKTFHRWKYYLREWSWRDGDAPVAIGDIAYGPGPLASNQYYCVVPTTRSVGLPWVNTGCWIPSAIYLPAAQYNSAHRLLRARVTASIERVGPATFATGAGTLRPGWGWARMGIPDPVIDQSGQTTTQLAKTDDIHAVADRSAQSTVVGPQLTLTWPALPAPPADFENVHWTYTQPAWVQNVPVAPYPAIPAPGSYLDGTGPAYGPLAAGDDAWGLASCTVTARDAEFIFGPANCVWFAVNGTELSYGTAYVAYPVIIPVRLRQRVQLDQEYTPEECLQDAIDLLSSVPFGDYGSPYTATVAQPPTGNNDYARTRKIRAECTGPWCLYTSDSQGIKTCEQHTGGPAIELLPGSNQSVAANCHCAP